MIEKTYLYDGKTYSKKEIEKKVTVTKADNPGTRASETLKMIEGNDILDVGCSVGALTKYIALAGKERKVTGIDVLETAIEISKDFNNENNIKFEVRDLLKQPFLSDSFDCILFTETIEHVENPAQYLREFFRILRPGGHLILSTPNATSLKNILYALSHRKKAKRERIAKEISLEPKSTGTQLEHIYNWDYPTLVRLLDRCGFDIVDHSFVRSGPIVIPLFGKKIQVIKLDSNIFRKCEVFMTTMIIKAKKRSQEIN